MNIFKTAWIRYILTLSLGAVLMLTASVRAQPELPGLTDTSGKIRGEATQTPAQPPKTFAVSGFPVIAAKAAQYSWLGVGLGDDLSSRLARCEGSLLQVERLQFNEVLRAAKVDMLTEGVSAQAQPKEPELHILHALAGKVKEGEKNQQKFLGAHYLLVGSLWLEGDYGQPQAQLRANVRLISAATAEVVSSVQAQGPGTREGFLDLQERLAEQLAEKMGVAEDKRIRVRNYSTDGGEAYKLFAQARELLYQGKYQEAQDFCRQAEAAGAVHLLMQIRTTDRQAHERLIKTMSKTTAYNVGQDRIRLQKKRAQEAKELQALENYGLGEECRILADKAATENDPDKAKQLRLDGIAAYNDYLKDTGNRMLLWVYEGEGIDFPVIVDGIAFAGSMDKRLRAFDAKTGKLLWDFRAEGWIETPVVVDGIAYAGSLDNHLRAFEARTGKLLWQFKAGDRVFTPAVADGIVYAGSWDKHVRALAAGTGQLLWQFQAGDLVGPPVVADGIVYVRLGVDDKHLQALDGKTGKLLWQFKAGDRIYPPVAVDGIVYVGSEDKHLRAFEAGTGKLLWQFQAGNGINSPVAADGIILVVSPDKHLRAFEGKTGKLLWQFQAGDRIETPVIMDGIAYAGSTDKYLRAFEAGTGKLLWEVRSGKDILAPVVVDGIAYAGSGTWGKHLRAFAAKTGKLLWEFQAEMDIRTPVIVDGVAYTTSGKRLLAFNHSIIFSSQGTSVTSQAQTAKAVMLQQVGRPEEAVRILGRELADNSYGNEPIYRCLQAWAKQLNLPGEIQDTLSQRLRQLIPATESRLPADAWLKNPPLIWQFQAGDQIDTPVVVDGIVYARSGDKHLRALEAGTGRLLWQFQAQDQFDTPRVVDGIVYAGSEDKHLRAFDAKTGKLLWQFQAGGRIDTPALAAGNAYAGSEDNHLRVFEAKTGKLLGQLQTEDRIYTPVVADGIAYAGSGAEHLRAFEVKTGQLLWQFQIPWGAILPPMVVDGIVYARSFDSQLRALEGKTGKLLWQLEAGMPLNNPVTVVEGIAYTGSMDNHLRACEAKTGNLRWEFRAGNAINSPVVVNGIAYAGSFDNLLRAFEARTGQLLWQFQAGQPINNPITVADGIVYAGSMDKHLRAFAAVTGKLLWDFQADNLIDAPVVVDGVGYTGSMDRYLRAFAVKDVSSGRYAPEISWGSELQFWSYLIWGKAGLAARQILEGYTLANVLAQNNLTPDELAGALDKLASGEPYFTPGSLALDPVRLCPAWLKFSSIRVGDQPARPALALYIEAARKDKFGASAYLQEAKRLAPDLDLEKLGFAASSQPK